MIVTKKKLSKTKKEWREVASFAFVMFPGTILSFFMLQARSQAFSVP